jgi:hypothetical protein
LKELLDAAHRAVVKAFGVPERDEILQFIQNSPRGIVKGYGTGKDRE